MASLRRFLCRSPAVCCLERSGIGRSTASRFHSVSGLREDGVPLLKPRWIGEKKTSIFLTTVIFAGFTKLIFPRAALTANCGIRSSFSHGQWPMLPEAMKIVFFNTSNGVYEYASGNSRAVGGAERQQWLLARALVDAGWSVTVGLQGVFDFGSRTTIGGVHFAVLSGSQTFLAPYQRLLSLYHFL